MANRYTSYERKPGKVDQRTSARAPRHPDPHADKGKKNRDKRPRGAKRSSGGGFFIHPREWLQHHAQAFFFSLGRLAKNPISSLMTASVIGISLALPAGLFVVVENASLLSSRWDSAAEISLFLRTDVDDISTAKLADTVRARPDVQDTLVITRSAALEEFKEYSDFGDAIDLLGENPLPAVIVVNPLDVSAFALDKLLKDLSTYPQVDKAKLDRDWLERLRAIIVLIERGLAMVFVLLGFAVVVIVGNTIRLDINNRRAEIQVIKLVGGTDAFIRRPFLYSGLWYGLGGGLIAASIVGSTLLLISGPFARVVSLFGSNYDLAGLGFIGNLQLIAAGALFGLLGSWLAVGRHLKEIEPV